ncbi:hypothetical protein KUCAC02_030297, partial [Chaenocephalus aceratus]
MPGRVIAEIYEKGRHKGSTQYPTINQHHLRPSSNQHSARPVNQRLRYRPSSTHQYSARPSTSGSEGMAAILTRHLGSRCNDFLNDDLGMGRLTGTSSSGSPCQEEGSPSPVNSAGELPVAILLGWRNCVSK